MTQQRPGRALWTQIIDHGLQWPARVWIAGSTLTVKRLWPGAQARTVDLRGAKLERWVFGVNLVLPDDEIRFTVPSKRLGMLLLAHGATEFGDESGDHP